MPENRGEKRICLGAFAGAHGVRGDAIVKTFTETPDAIAAYGPLCSEDGERVFTLRFLRDGKPGFAVVTAPEITSREDAEALKGVRLYVDRTALPETSENEFYLDDLIGLAAIDEAGAPAGRVCAVHNFGAGDIIELGDIPGVSGSRMIPFTKAAAPSIDLENQRLTVSRAALDAVGHVETADDPDHHENES